MNEQQWYAVCWKTFLDVWKLFKKYSREQSPDWEKVHQEALEIRRRHPSRLCEDMLLAVITELDRRKKC